MEFFEEKSHQPLSREAIDRLRDDDWQEFCVDAILAEQGLDGQDPASEEAAELAVKCATELTEKFGSNLCGKRCYVVGLAYPATAVDDGQYAELTSLHTDSIAFQGVDIRYINGKWQSVLEFYMAEEDADLPRGHYYAPPDKHHLMELRIEPEAEEDPNEEGDAVVNLLHQEMEAAGDLVMHGEFTLMPAEDQYNTLQSIIDSADSVIPEQLYEYRVAIEGCLKYYTSYDDMPGFDLRDFYSDQSEESPEERQPLGGYLRGFEYLDLRAVPDGSRLKPADFTFNDGAPCLILRSKERGRTYYLLPQSIEKIS